MLDEQKVTSCLGCAYYYVTWDPKRPKGCKYFGFKSMKMPCAVVKESSGEYCSLYTPKQKNSLVYLI